MPSEEEWALLARLLTAAGLKEKAAPLAESLLVNYGSIAQLADAVSRDVKSGLPESTRVMLGMIPGLSRMCMLEKIGGHPTLDTFARAAEYASALYIGAHYESVCLLCLDQKYRLIEPCSVNEGCLAEVPFYPRRLLQEALKLDAQVVILCHNHPSGRAQFSDADIFATRNLLHLFAAVGLSMPDHLLIAGCQAVSMRAELRVPEKLWTATGPLVRPAAEWGKNSRGR